MKRLLNPLLLTLAVLHGLLSSLLYVILFLIVCAPVILQEMYRGPEPDFGARRDGINY